MEGQGNARDWCARCEIFKESIRIMYKKKKRKKMDTRSDKWKGSGRGEQRQEHKERQIKSKCHLRYRINLITPLTINGLCRLCICVHI